MREETVFEVVSGCAEGFVSKTMACSVSDVCEEI
jgi:hypothetical protein